MQEDEGKKNKDAPDPSQMQLHCGHHILKSIVSYNSQNYYQQIQKERFMNDYDIDHKNA